jgi:hypothetical protein
VAKVCCLLNVVPSEFDGAGRLAAVGPMVTARSARRVNTQIVKTARNDFSDSGLIVPQASRPKLRCAAADRKVIVELLMVHADLIVDLVLEPFLARALFDPSIAR